MEALALTIPLNTNTVCWLEEGHCPALGGLRGELGGGAVGKTEVSHLSYR